MSRQIHTATEACGRRDFLRLAVVTGGAVMAVGGVAGTALAADDEAPEAEPPSPGQRGYRVSEHVKTYYEKARF